MLNGISMSDPPEDELDVLDFSGADTITIGSSILKSSSDSI